MLGYGDNPASIIIFSLAILLCLTYWICGCYNLISDCPVRSPPTPSRNPRFTTTAASRPLNSSASLRPTVAAPNSTSTTSSDRSAVPSILRMLPDFVYSAAPQKQNLNCCVCLTDLKDGDEGRFLPQCFHCFHVECIDMWLATHSQCPVCRASIDPAAPELAA